MKYFVFIIATFFSISSFAQDQEEQDLLAQKTANDFVYEGNILVDNEDFVSAEMEYRKAISEKPNYAVGAYNLGNSYYKKGNFEEALYRHKQTARTATTKDEKYRAFHNIGNILMQDKQCKEAAEAFKNALRNNPTDDETRYNYVLAKECAQQQEQDKQDENKDENKDKKEDQKEKDEEKEKEKEDENKEEKPEDEGEKDKKEGEDEEDEEGKPKDEKEEKGKGDEEDKDKPKPKPQPGQMSPQQMKNLLEAMNDQEQKVQDKMNAQKQKGARVQTEKDW